MDGSIIWGGVAITSLRTDTLAFDDDLHKRWVQREFAMLQNSKASPSIKTVLIKKAAVGVRGQPEPSATSRLATRS